MTEVKFKLGTGFTNKTAGTIYFDRVKHEIYVGNNLVAGDIFWATYGTTSYTDVDNAISNGKTVLVKRTVDGNTEVYHYVYESSSDVHSFTYISSDTIYRVSVSSENGTTWVYTTTTLETATNKVTVLSSSSSNIEYPSAKAVYDTLAPVEITWSDLKSLRDGNGLRPGALYRIIDYVATTSYSESRSANHPFDIIVEALATNKLSEEARAIQHAGDSHFSLSKLDAWKVWYCLDNATGRFAWADTTNGKGVVYRLIDEFKNDLPYDFKGIQFKRYKITGTTLSSMSDLVGLYFGLSEHYGMQVDTSDYKWFYTFTKLGSTWDDSIEEASYYSAAYVTDVVFDTGHLTDTNNNIPQLLNNVFAYGPVVKTLCNSMAGDSGAYSPFTYFTNLRFQGSDCKLNTILGAPGLVRTSNTFRKNFIFGAFRHQEVGSNFQQNTICCPHDNGFCWYGEHTEWNIIFCKRTYGQCVFGHNVQSNTINLTGSFQDLNIGSWFYSNNISGDSWFNSEIGVDVKTCTFTNTYLQSIYMAGQFTDCRFNGRFSSCTFNPICQYIDFVGGTGTSVCIGLDVVGNIRGTSQAYINLENPSDFVYPNASGIKRRIRVEGDVNGTDVVISWYDNSNHIRKIKGASGSTWTTLSNHEEVSNKVTTLSSSSTSTQYPSAEAVYDEVHPTVQSSAPTGGMLPNVLYTLGTLSGNTTFTFATAPDVNVYNEWMFQFTTPATAPTITWPAEITSWYGGTTPTINANKTYEVSVLNGLGVILEF